MSDIRGEGLCFRSIQQLYHRGILGLKKVEVFEGIRPILRVFVGESDLFFTEYPL